MDGKIDIGFVCYKYKWDNGVGTMFLFYPDGEWDEDKLTIQEAIKQYPPEKYEWINLELDEEKDIWFL